MTLTHLQKLPKNVRDLDKLIVSKGFEWLPKVQKIAQSCHTGSFQHERTLAQIQSFVVIRTLIDCDPPYKGDIKEKEANFRKTSFFHGRRCKSYH